MRTLIVISLERALRSLASALSPAALSLYSVSALVALYLGVSPVWAVTASVSGAWDNPVTWGGSAVPTSADPVTINSGITVTVPAGVAAACTDLTLGPAPTAATSVVLADASSSLAASGNVLVDRPGASNIVNAINVGPGTFTAGSLTLGNTSATSGSSRKTRLLISTGTATITGNLTTYQNAAEVVFSGAGTLAVGGTVTQTGTMTFTRSTGTVDFNGAGTQAVPVLTYNNLTLSGSGAKTMGTGVSVAGTLAIAPAGSAYASVTSGANLSVSKLNLGGVGALGGTWGSATGGASASHTSDTYFGTTTSGILTVAQDSSPSACDILTFGPGAVINQGAQTIVWKVPVGADLAALAPSYTISDGAWCAQPNPGVPSPNFSGGAVPYVIHAQDGVTTKTYTVTTEESPLPVWSGLACWYDASVGVATDGSGVTTWDDQSGLGHQASRASGTVTLVPGDINGKPAVHLRGSSTFMNCAGGMFTKEQYLVVRSPNATWNGSGSFLGRRSDVFLSVRMSSYNMTSGTTGFWQDHFPTAVSKNGAGVTAGSGSTHFLLAPITNYMILKIIVDASADAANLAAYPYYQIGKNETLGTMDFDVAEIIGYSTTLSAADEAKVGAYLADKYAVTTTYPLLHVPAAPTGLTAEPLLHAVLLNWTAPWSAASYYVYRGTTSGVYDPTPIATVSGGATTYTDTHPSADDGKIYFYVVSGTNTIGEGPRSAEASAAPSSGKANQTITFGPLAAKTYGDAPFSITATASPSLLPVSFASSDETVATVSGNMVTILKAGTTTITASQAGDDVYNPAASVNQDLTVSMANQAITFTSGPRLVRGTADPPFADPATGGASGNPVTYVSTNEAAATVDSSGLVTIVGVGTTEIQANQDGTPEYYNPAPQVSQTLIVIPALLPVTSGLACWYDAGFGITEDGSGVASWDDRSTLGHLATRASGTVTLVAGDINGRPAVHLRGSSTYLNCAGGMFTKEQYLVVRSPNATWNGSGSFLGRVGGFLEVRASSYNFYSGYTGFWDDQLPAAVSKNGAAVSSSRGSMPRGGFELGTITDYMILKITVNNSADPANLAARPYCQIGKCETLGTMDFDVAEIIGYDHALSSGEADTMTAYLTSKYMSAGQTYADWAAQYAGSGTPEGDYNNDGVQNGIAFFMGANGLATLPGVVDGMVTWPRVNAVTSFEVQVSDNLADWVTATTGVDTSDPAKVVFTLPSGATRKFCRLVVAP